MVNKKAEGKGRKVGTANGYSWINFKMNSIDSLKLTILKKALNNTSSELLSRLIREEFAKNQELIDQLYSSDFGALGQVCDREEDEEWQNAQDAES